MWKNARCVNIYKEKQRFQYLVKILQYHKAVFQFTDFSTCTKMVKRLTTLYWIVASYSITIFSWVRQSYFFIYKDSNTCFHDNEYIYYINIYRILNSFFYPNNWQIFLYQSMYLSFSIDTTIKLKCYYAVSTRFIISWCFLLLGNSSPHTSSTATV